ncbi:MAG: hypothetical protein AUJ34_00035 [Parcubacteria group bacterium CG1_02_41_12]|nr:MAG: hypothetical protein AUJ34_00035 [Parcubacteria group bacterium CG1_02_41_12]
MLLEVHRTSRFKKSYKKLPPPIQENFAKRIEIFQKDPYYPSLETHKLHSALGLYYAFYLKDGFRVLFEFQNNNTVLLINVGSHDDYEKWERIY